MKSKFLLCYSAILSVFGCGSGGGAEDSSLNMPSEQILCALTLGMSSRADALRVLGPPAASSGGAELSILDYHYGDFGTAMSVSDIAALELDFDANEVLHDASVVNIPFPQCWKDEQTREHALTGN